MKFNTSIYIALILSGASFVGCKKDFLQRDPKSTITDNVFFSSTNDLETYSNGFYEQLPTPVNDMNSDNIATHNVSVETDQLVRGMITQDTYGTWQTNGADNWSKKDWGKLRAVNYMLDNAAKVTGSQVDIDHYIGIARFFRAMFYFDKIKKYSDVPWYGSVLNSEDEALYKGRDSRAFVVDKVLEDLQFAVDHIKADGTNTRITKWAALALQARFGLYEGTFRKYHAELNLAADYSRFLTLAATASNKIMTEGSFLITGTSADDYAAIFNATALSANKEIILWKDYDPALNVGNGSALVLNYNFALSRSLAEAYLNKDGSRFTDFTKSFLTLFDNRDPRMKATINYPGWIQPGTTVPYRINPTMGGYAQIKYYPARTELNQGFEKQYNDIPVFRLGEILLINAEAKAEQGAITQTDLDNTVNKLRKRVGMPDMTLAVALDPALVAQYPNAAGGNLNVLLEIRRERRVELACEGFRFDDLMRWKVGKLIQNNQQGMYIPALGAYDVTGDGVQDIAVLASPADESPIAALPPAVKAGLAKYYLKDAAGKDNTFYLSGATSGFVSFTRDREQPRNFIEPKYYYRPIPRQETLLNPNLKQIFGWDQ
ncbi:RagB/SusD family nutrient uptake outer membrane protein [Pedobacter africanus]|uniref:Starch-binding associating with outer membrane n=1 Tax=Pedobacter africanus TaxID=151894 RepID=A0A1W2D9T8_9SPHI|nr:RagB/SusD family nutrient uptake outer membrane protein [Pedobacter africanus]SMC94327.1 Starch-binding associating with outer membrane [Pedobacter africanus]